jgi:hypothetical protein
MYFYPGDHFNDADDQHEKRGANRQYVGHRCRQVFVPVRQQMKKLACAGYQRY